MVAELIAINSEADRVYAIGYLRRKARRTALDAARAAPSLSAQLKSLAALFESQAEQLEQRIAVAIEDMGDYASA